MPDLKFAGEKMTFFEDDQGTAHITFDDKGTGRVCGSCSLCCKLLPVPPLAKAAGERCKHQRAGKGCTIYDKRPLACRTWSCRWLADATTAGLPRPDRCHYVIDLEYDFIRYGADDGPADKRMDVVQVWVDPAFPDAHRAPELRAYLLRLAERFHIGAIIRWGQGRALLLFAPPLTGSDHWVERADAAVEKRNPAERWVGRGISVG